MANSVFCLLSSAFFPCLSIRFFRCCMNILLYTLLGVLCYTNFREQSPACTPSGPHFIDTNTRLLLTSKSSDPHSAAPASILPFSVIRIILIIRIIRPARALALTNSLITPHLQEHAQRQDGLLAMELAAYSIPVGFELCEAELLGQVGEHGEGGALDGRGQMGICCSSCLFVGGGRLDGRQRVDGRGGSGVPSVVVSAGLLGILV